MSGTAKITNNTAISNGGGVLVARGYAITLGGEVEITGNKVGDNRDNNLYLGRDTTVQTDSLTGKETIGVTTYNSPTDDSSVTITSNAASVDCFFSDNSNYEIGTDAVAGVVLKCKEKLPTVPDPEPKTFTYDTTEHTGIELGENYTVARGTNSATDAGTYEVIIKPFAGKTWENGTADEKTFNWEITKASQSAPTGLEGEKPTTAGGSDGKIIGVNVNMEYRKSEDSSYIACTGTEITGLLAGTYEVRYKGDKNHEESPAFVVTVPDADMPVYILEIINGTGNGTYVEGTVVTITANPAADGKVFDKWVKMYGDAVIADENSATTTVTTKIAPTTIKATYKDSETTPTPNPEPTPNPNPEPTPTPTLGSKSDTGSGTNDINRLHQPQQPGSFAVRHGSGNIYILDGAGSSWTQNTDGSLAIRGSGEISKFREVKVDGLRLIRLTIRSQKDLPSLPSNRNTLRVCQQEIIPLNLSGQTEQRQQTLR
ncbi:MAG: InlB B-repeat-containing protein [Eubacterium sp.]